MRPLVIIGAGGFGREVHDIVVAVNAREPTWDFVGFIDDGEPDHELLSRRGARWLGPTERLHDHRGAHFVVGVGSPAVRRRLAAAAEGDGLQPTVLIHPSATLGLDVEIGPGTIICSHVSITTNVRVGRHVHLDQNVTVGHDVEVGDFARVNPGSTISGSVYLAEGVTIGTNAAVIQCLTIQSGATVGAGAVVTGDVSANVTVVGVPARPLTPHSREAGASG